MGSGLRGVNYATLPTNPRYYGAIAIATYGMLMIVGMQNTSAKPARFLIFVAGLFLTSGCSTSSSTQDFVETTVSNVVTTTTSPVTAAELLSRGLTCKDSWSLVPKSGKYGEMVESDRIAVRSTLYSCENYDQWETTLDEVRGVGSLLGISLGGERGPLQEFCDDEPRANPSVCISAGEFVAYFDSIPKYLFGKVIRSNDIRPNCKEFWQASSANWDNSYGDLFLRASLYACGTFAYWTYAAASVGENGNDLFEAACLLEPHAHKICD